MLTEKDYCDYETSVDLRELGFTLDMTEKVYERNLMTNRYETIPKPLLYEVQKWLREEKGMLLQPTYLELSDEWICVIRDKNKRHGHSAQKQSSYEDALQEGINEAVKILKDYETIHE